MAGRHYFPYIPVEDVGPDAEKIVPVFPQLDLIKYKKGMDVVNLVAMFRGKTRVALEAPPCSRKSVDVPAALLRGGLRPLVVHAVPSRLLAAATHDYVVTVHKDVMVSFVEDYVSYDSFPMEGLVHVSTGVLVAYMAAWRARGVDMHFVLFLDEMHESDFATATLRETQVAAPGVDIYVEATATRGTGVGGAFVRSDLPSSVTDYHFQSQSAVNWDMMERGKPWSCIKTTGDMLVFEDDPQEAIEICRKFTEAGVRAYRLHARMAVADYRRAMHQVAFPGLGEGIAAMVVDYSFRSGFTYPTVTRIIDPAEVRYMQIDHGLEVYRKRKAYAAEVYQTRHRGARMPGMDCHYWRPDYLPDCVRVDLEGVEFDLACVAFRMLGLRPNGRLKNGRFSTGKLPRSFTRVMAGDRPLCVYKVDEDWPGASKAPPSPGSVSPCEVQFSPVEEKGEHAASIYTLDEESSIDGIDDVGGITEEVFKNAKARASAVRERPKLNKPLPIPRLGEAAAGEIGSNFSRIVGSDPVQQRMEFGRYYYSHALSAVSLRSFSSFGDVLADIGSTPSEAYVRTKIGSVKKEVCALALIAYNDAVVVATAAAHVMRSVADSQVVQSHAQPEELRQWAMFVRAEYHRTETIAKQAMDLLTPCREYALLEMSGQDEYEAKVASEFLDRLSVSLHSSEGIDNYRKGYYPNTAIDPSGAYQIQIQPNGWRERLALVCLGNSPGVIQMAIAGETNRVGLIDTGQENQPVFTTASQLALASVKAR